MSFKKIKLFEYCAKFFQGKSGESSSKRLAFIFSFIVVFYEYDQLIAELVMVKAYSQAMDVFMYGAIAMLTMGGFVTAEVFKKHDKVNK